MNLFKAGLFGMVLVVSMALLSCAPTLVPKGWELLAKQEVSFASSREVIELPMAVRPLKGLLIVARMNDLEIYGLRVMFDNGDDYAPDIRLKMKANVDSHAVDLPGNERRVRSVEIRYRKVLDTTRRAAVELWGK